MKNFILLLFGIIFSNMIFTQTFDVSFNDIYSTDSLSAWIIGDEGTIIHLDNGGTTLEDHSFPTSLNLHSICFASEQRGFIVGDSGLVFRTDNAGDTWNIVDLGVTNYLSSVEFYNNHYGWITGLYPGGLYRTTDGGDTWNEINAGTVETFFLDSLNGWGQILGSIARTYDGGVSWTNISTAGGTGVSRIFFIDTLTGFKCTHAYGSFGSYLSHDGGYNWTPTNLGDDVGANDVYFLDTLNGWVCGSSIWYSNDLFETYNAFYGTGPFNSLSIHGYSNGWAVSYGSVWKLEGTNNWIQLDLVGVPEKNNSESIKKCFPNPFSEMLTIDLELKNIENIKISIHDQLGREIETLFEGKKNKKTFQLTWDSGNLPRGVYLLKLQTDNAITTQKLIKE